MYLEGNFGATTAAPPQAAGGAGGGRASSPLPSIPRSPPPPIVGNAGITNEQGGGVDLDPRTLRDEEMARYYIPLTLITQSHHTRIAHIFVL